MHAGRRSLFAELNLHMLENAAIDHLNVINKEDTCLEILMFYVISGDY